MSVKEEVLKALATQPGKDISGSKLAGQCHVTRNAIWKAIQSLRADGYQIEAVTNRGYRLTLSDDTVSEPRITPALTTRWLGQDLRVFPVLDSTNNYLKQLATEGSFHGTAAIADSQLGGKGRRGRGFYSPASSGIYLSVLLRPTDSAEVVSLYTSCTAVAVAQAIEAVAEVSVGIKWVNDLFIQGKKVCGILTEATMDLESGGVDYAIIGIGINVAPMEFPAELQEIATSISNACGQAVSRNRLIAEILNRLEPALEQCSTRSFLEESKRRSIVLGKEITVHRGGDIYPAKAIDINRQGHLVVETSAGLRHLSSGEVSIKMKG